MESFFLAETTKYLYLLFDPDNFIHNPGTHADIHETEDGGRCVLDAGGYIFNSEAHPIDPAALACCSGLSEKEVKDQIANHIIDIFNPQTVREFRGDLVPERIKKINEKIKQDLLEKREREQKMREQMEELRLKAELEAAEIKRRQAENEQKIRQEITSHEKESIRDGQQPSEAIHEGQQVAEGQHLAFAVQEGQQKADAVQETQHPAVAVQEGQHPANVVQQGQQQADAVQEGQHSPTAHLADAIKEDQQLAEMLGHLSDGIGVAQIVQQSAEPGQDSHHLFAEPVQDGQIPLADHAQVGRQQPADPSDPAQEYFQNVEPLNDDEVQVVFAEQVDELANNSGTQQQQPTGQVEAADSGDSSTHAQSASGDDSAHAQSAGGDDSAPAQPASGDDSAPARAPIGPAGSSSDDSVGEGTKKALPEFALQKETNPEEEAGGGAGYVTDMLQKLSRGDFLSTAHNGGIIQPAKMPNMFERRANLVIETLSNLMGRFLPLNSYEFRLEEFTEKLQQSSRPVNESWVADWAVMSCPAQKFTDRFLIHGEFFTP